jgi:hypothetical protein
LRAFATYLVTAYPRNNFWRFSRLVAALGAFVAGRTLQLSPLLAAGDGGAPLDVVAEMLDP